MHSHLRSRTPSAVRASLLAAALATLGASAFAEIRVMCYQDGNECDVTADLIKRYERQNPGAKVILDVVPYKTVVEQLPIQLAAGKGPDIARVAEIGGLSKNYIDISPYLKDRKYWEANFGGTLPCIHRRQLCLNTHLCELLLGKLQHFLRGTVVVGRPQRGAKAVREARFF